MLWGVEMKDTDAARARIEAAKDAGLNPQQQYDYAARAGRLDIQKETADAGRNVIADSLQRIGGGGGAGFDPAAANQQRMVDLTHTVSG